MASKCLSFAASTSPRSQGLVIGALEGRGPRMTLRSLRWPELDLTKKVNIVERVNLP